MPRILIADDERPLRMAIERFIRSLGMESISVASGEEAMLRLSECDVLISDVRMPGIDGIQLLREARRVRPDLPVVILTGNGTVGLAVEAMRCGAANFLTKPFDLSELEQIIRGIVDPASQHAPEPRKAEQSVYGPPVAPVGDILLGSSPAMVELRDLVARVAPSDATVLVTGASGVGKEVVARAIHKKSKRARGPFVAVNCGAIPEALLESELFGHVKGAFTGASQTRLGRFAQAQGGTLLLDEIGELPLAMQVKLLRVLQERSYTPVGGSEIETADVRVIAATHRDLESMVAEGSFREDLYWRLNVVPMTVPSLRDREEDVFELARTFLAREAAREGRPPMDVDADALVCMRRYAWPGNVRELEHALTRAVVLSTGDSISLADLPPRVRAAYSGAPSPARAMPALAIASAPVAVLPEDGLDLAKELSRVEQELIRQAMIRTGGNKNRAAALLKLNRTTLVEKIKRYAFAS
jgi:DNA-binding NtrC family response regulator